VGRCARVVSCAGDVSEALVFSEPVALPEGPITLSVRVDHARQQFYWQGAGELQALGPELDASVISDEGGVGEHGSFTGAFVGMVAYDLTGQGWSADFTRFSYRSQPAAG
jgi:xylan 1,4-beta-xylosidase